MRGAVGIIEGCAGWKQGTGSPLEAQWLAHPRQPEGKPQRIDIAASRRTRTVTPNLPATADPSPES